MKLTIFTPTYNRASLLPRLYKSLKKQSDNRFEWVIVDDGSIDNTQELVQSYINEDIIEINYFKQANAGKHIAINTGVNLAKGELFFIVDSDDYLIDEAVGIIIKDYQNFKTIGGDVAGISYRRGYSIKKPIGSLNFTKEVTENVFDFRLKRKVVGDMAEVVSTEVLKKYPFPKINEERFLTEALIWNRIGLKYKMIWKPEIIYIGEYQKGGLTDKNFEIRKKSPEGALLFYKELQTMPISFVQKIRANINYWRFAKFSKRSFQKKFSEVNLIYSIFGIPLSLIFLIKDPK